MDEFYTYIYYDPLRNNIPMYVGKGTNNRAWEHLFRESMNRRLRYRIKILKKNNIEPVIGLYSGLDEEFSFLLEKELISKFGRKDLGTGSLYNLTDGGEGETGRLVSKETRNKISKLHTGKIVSEETKQKMREAKLGKKFSLEHREKLSQSHTGKRRSGDK